MIVTIAKDILKGLDYLHRRDLAHRDLKVSSVSHHGPATLVQMCSMRDLKPAGRVLTGHAWQPSCLQAHVAEDVKRLCLQADNLLLHDDGRVLLADFGATAQLERSEFVPECVGLARSDRSNGSGGSLASISEQDSSTHSAEGLTPAVQPPLLLDIRRF